LGAASHQISITQNAHQQWASYCNRPLRNKLAHQILSGNGDHSLATEDDEKSSPAALERLEACLKPSVPRMLQILVTGVGEPDKILELVLNEPIGRPQQYWQASGEKRQMTSAFPAIGAARLPSDVVHKM
jgi:hypothetical protein